MVKGKPAQYAFLSELAMTPVRQVSIETAQPGIDYAVLRELRDKTILLGVLDLSTHDVETPARIAERLRRAMQYVPAERLIVAPDCGMKYLPRAVAFAKLQAMVAGTRRVRAEIEAGAVISG